MEIYNDRVYDLLYTDLKASAIETQSQEIKMTLINGTVGMPGLTVVNIDTED